MNINKKHEIVGKFWSDLFRKNLGSKLKTRWWQSPDIIRHVNYLVCGDQIDGLSQGLINIIKKEASNDLPFSRGISVGCGIGQKEINLVKQGIVKRFDLFELSKEKISYGEALVRKNGLEDNIKFTMGNAFKLVVDSNEYDFVYWNNSLHHMDDVFYALEWSRKILKNGGFFCMDDFVGSSRFQWPDKQLEIASTVRRVFNESKYLRNPENKDLQLECNMQRPDIKEMIKSDPSEAADSERIIDAVKIFFPEAIIEKTGGVIYHLALSDMLHNFDEKEDKIIMDLLMIIDTLCIELNENHYAIAYAFKK